MTFALYLIFISSTKSTGLPIGLIESVCWVESKYQVDAVHKNDGRSDSFGVCQIKPIAAKQVGFKGSAKDLMKPEVNIKYAAKYLKYNIERYNGNITKGLIAYNRGNARGLETTEYSKKVMEKFALNQGNKECHTQVH